MNKERLVLQISHPGLGDHLFLTPAPRIAKTILGFQKVFISNQSNFRNPEIKHLIWELNPYIDGFVDEPGIVVPDVTVQQGENLIDALLRSVGLDDQQKFHEPEIYYQPRMDERFAGKAIYDPNYVSFVGFVSKKKISNYFKRNSIQIDGQMKIRGRNFALPMDVPFFETQSLKEYCDLIHSCKEFFCLTSGSATLASAMGKKSTVFWGFRQKRIFHHSKLHNYVYVPASPFEMANYYLRKYLLGKNDNIR